MSQIAANYGAVAKFSEAGGGDCSVGVCFESKIAKKVIYEWQNQGIMLVDVGISENGIQLDNNITIED
jgi:mevalonate kinase